MCGIVGYLGNKKAYPILIDGLKSLEYRGYDSAGVALLENNELVTLKKKGKVNDLKDFVASKLSPTSTVGIGHTRWATHGKPSDVNAHPHTSSAGNLAMVHNGIIENYRALKEELIQRGHHFESSTDSEVLIHLIEEIQVKSNCSLEVAVQQALDQVEGAYAIIVMSLDDPERLIVAKKSSPLVIGLGEEEYFIASDVKPIATHTNRVIHLNDGEMAIMRTNHEITIKTLKNKIVSPFIEELNIHVEENELNGHDFFMHKEIHEQPQVIKDCLSGRLNLAEKEIKLKGIDENLEVFKNAKRLIILACGTSWHAGIVGKYIIEETCRIPVQVEYASEFRYKNPIVNNDDVVITISQSGETADSLSAMEIAKEKGAFLYAICNVVGSTISRFADAGTYTRAGSEIGVASTKAFISQVCVLFLIALKLGKIKGSLDETLFDQLTNELEFLPQAISEMLKSEKKIQSIAKEYASSENFLFLGRGNQFPIALEGALKLKEISYIHAEGYPAAEMKHGPIALIDSKMPVLVLATNKTAYGKVVSNMQEIKAREGMIIAVANEGNEQIKEIADHVIYVPEVADQLSPILSVVPLQFLAYYAAIERGCNVDQPRNLAKSVTVE